MRSSSLKTNQSARILLVGLGRVGWFYDYSQGLSATFLSHYKSIINTARREKYQIELFYFDKDKNACDKFLSITQEDSNNLLNSESELCDDGWDLVILAVSTNNLVSTLTPILRKTKTPKFVVEKPFTNKREVLKNFLESTSQEERNRIRVGFPRRTLPSSKKIHDLIKSWSIDRYTHLSLEFSGGFSNIGSHFIDLLEYWFGQLEIVRMSSHRDILIRGIARPNLTVEIKQTGLTNQEDATIICDGFEYTRAGRHIKIYNETARTEEIFENEIEQMLLFESADYLNWIFHDKETFLTPITSKALDLSLRLENAFKNV